METALTKEDWEAMQLSISEDNELVAFSDEEMAVLKERIRELDRDATKAALTELIRRHPVEFTLILNSERIKGLKSHEDNQLELFVQNVLDS
jgi:hypothetical protein